MWRSRCRQTITRRAILTSRRALPISELPPDAPPRSPRTDEQLVAEFERFLNRLINALNDVKRYRSWAREHGKLTHGPLSEMAAKVLVAKILRIAAAVGALCRGRHGEETGPLLRTLLLAYVNLKFISMHENREGAAMRYSRHIWHARGRLKDHLVRPDVEGEAFPVQDPDAWDADEAELAEQWRQIDDWARANGVVEFAALATA